MLAFCSQGSEFKSLKSHSFFLWKIPLSVFGTQKSKVLVTDENWTQDFPAKVDWLIKAPPAFPAFTMSLFQVYLHSVFLFLIHSPYFYPLPLPHFAILVDGKIGIQLDIVAENHCCQSDFPSALSAKVAAICTYAYIFGMCSVSSMQWC